MIHHPKIEKIYEGVEVAERQPVYVAPKKEGKKEPETGGEKKGKKND